MTRRGSLADRSDLELPGQGGVIVFDGECVYCNRWVDRVIRLDRRARYLLTANQSEAGRELLRNAGLNPEQMESIALIRSGSVWTESTAVLKIAQGLGLPWSALGTLGQCVPRLVRDKMYRWVARNRYRWFGRLDQCRRPSDQERARFLVSREDVGRVPPNGTSVGLTPAR